MDPMEKRAHILVVDDEQAIADLVVNLLVAEGMDALACYSGQAALDMLGRTPFDLAIVDIMMPGIDGFELCVRMRQMMDIPVIFLSAKDEEADQVVGFTLGAEDYVTKPFVLRELLARVAVRLREAPAREGGAISFGPLRLDADARWVAVDGAEVRLTRTEYAILRLLMASPSQVITKSRLLDEIARDTPDCTESSLKTHVSNLRKKLRDAGAGDCIESVWGIGFKMRTE